MRYPPRRAQMTQVLEWEMGRGRHVLDHLVGQEPLEIRVNGTAVTVTMRTPGDDFELATGFLFGEGITPTGAEIRRIAYGSVPDRRTNGNIVDVTLHEDTPPDLDQFHRHFAATSSCGVCRKASIDAVTARGLTRPRGDALIDPKRLCALPDRLRLVQVLFGENGWIARGRFIRLRRSACERARGRRAPQRRRQNRGPCRARERLVPLSNHVLVVSGRGGFEIVQKALVAGVPVMASVLAPSSCSAVRLAREYDLTLVGFLQAQRFVVYAGEGRIIRHDAAGILYSRRTAVVGGDRLKDDHTRNLRAPRPKGGGYVRLNLVGP